MTLPRTARRLVQLTAGHRANPNRFQIRYCGETLPPVGEGRIDSAITRTEDATRPLSH
jgi:hypothetical protein